MTPYFSSFQEFMHMGGLGVYVWSCYAIVVGCMAGLILYTKAERKQTIAKLKRQNHRETDRQARLTNKQRQALAKS